MRILGIYITDDLIRMGLLNDADKQPAVKEYQSTSASLKATLKKNNIQPDRVILYIPRTVVSMRFLRIPSVNDAEVAQMVSLDQSASFPFKPEELIFSHTVVAKHKDGYSTVLLAAVQKDVISRMTATLKAAGLAPDEISVSTISVFNQLRSTVKFNKSTFVVNADKGFADLFFIKDEQLLFSRAVSEDELAEGVEQTARILQESGERIDVVIRDSVVPVVNGLLTLNKSGNLAIDLLPLEHRERKKREERKRALVYLVTLFLLNCAIVANIVFMKVKAQDAYLSMIRKEISRIELDAQDVQKKMRKAQILLESSTSGRIILGLLSELYRTAPDQVVLSSLDISGKISQGSIIMVGQAPGSESVLKFANSMKAGGFIKKAEVNYITRRAMSGGQSVDFEIRAGF